MFPYRLPIVLTRQYSQAVTVGQINVLLQTQLYAVDEVKWTSNAASTVKKVREMPA